MPGRLLTVPLEDSRVLPPDARALGQARDYSTYLLIRAAQRMRAENYRAGRVGLHLGLLRWEGWSTDIDLPLVRDDQACLAGLARLWARAEAQLPARANRIIHMIRTGAMP